jgi:putative PIN family toxin of toxin-antitoxin system
VRAVVDTNVWVSGLIRPDGPPGRILAAVRDRRMVALASWALAEEIIEVLRRPALAQYGLTEADVEDVTRLLGPLLPTVELEVAVRDPDDAPVIAAAVSAAADTAITGDADLLADPALRSWLSERGIAVLTPAQALTRLDA